MTTHALFSPSSHHTWSKCAGALAMQKDIPNTSSKFAEEGTAAHEVLAYCLDGYIFSGELRDPHTLVGFDVIVKDAKTFRVTEEMAGYVKVTVDKVEEILSTYVSLGYLVDLQVEVKVDFSDYIGQANQTGTSDVIFHARNRERLVIQVLDFKYGRGVKVDAKDNGQMRLYALGALGAAVKDSVEIVTSISQPRLGHYDEERIPLSELLEFGEQVKKDALQAMKCFDMSRIELVKQLTPGEDQCRFCRAKHDCPSLEKKVARAAFEGFDDISSIPDDAAPYVPDDPERLAKLMDKLELIKGWISAVTTKVQADIFSGKKIPGYKLVQGKMGNRNWVDENEVKEFIEANDLNNLAFEFAVKSPAQLEKVLKKDYQEAWKELEKKITRKSGALAVVPESDKRDEVDELKGFD